VSFFPATARLIARPAWLVAGRWPAAPGAITGFAHHDLPIRTDILERDAIGLNRITLLSLCLSMIFSENRCPLFRIML